MSDPFTMRHRFTRRGAPVACGEREFGVKKCVRLLRFVVARNARPAALTTTVRIAG